MTNPGDFRIEISDALSGGVSDPRNGTMMKMFNLIDIGERAGSGVPSIFSVWKQQGWSEPTITVSSEPNRSTLVLPLTKNGNKKSAIKIGDKKSAITAAKVDTIITYLTDHPIANANEIAQVTGLKPSRTRDYLNKLIQEGIVVAEGGNRNRTYRLKS